MEVTQAFIRELHFYVLNHDEEHRGRYREGSVFIEGSDTVTALPQRSHPVWMGLSKTTLKQRSAWVDLCCGTIPCGF